MRNVLSSLLITVALGAGAHALWACGQVDGQPMTPEQVREYRMIRMDSEGSGEPIPTPQEIFGKNPTSTSTTNGSTPTSSSSSSTSSSSSSTPSTPAAPPQLPTYVTQGQSYTQVTGVTKHDPTADLVVPQIDLVPDIGGDIGPDGNTTPQVM